MKGSLSDTPPDAGKRRELEKVQKLVARVQEGSLDAGGELFAFVMTAAEPYLRSTVQFEDIEPELEEVVSVVWDAIRDGALIRPDFLTSFVETLIWQQVRLHLSRIGKPVPSGPAFLLIRGGRSDQDEGTAPGHPLLAPQ